MKNPIIPENETDRLNVLKSYKILDTLPEIDYDDITKIASLICGTPIALITLIDEKRQFLKSRMSSTISETPRELSFCSHAINHPNDLMEVPDSRNDVRFADNPYVTGSPFVVFYAGMPLVTPEGYALGTLCVIDNKPRVLSIEQKEVLKSLARQVVHLLELRKKKDLLLQSELALSEFARVVEDFSYAAAHDLKEPLRMIKSFLGLLDKKYHTIFDERAKQYIYQAINGVDRMQHLINNLLDYSKAGSDQEEMEIVDLNEVISSVKELFNLEIKEQNIQIHSMDLPVILISSTDIYLIFQNLIGNAIKFSVPDKIPVIEIKVNETKTHWQFSVVDNGIGILKANLHSVFSLFKRLHSNEAYAGSGIGLAICKKIVEKNEGKIWVESEEGKGCSFHFTIKKLNYT